MAEADFPSNVSELPYSGDGDLARIKMQPHSVEAEQSVLGGLLLSADAWDSVAELVDPSDFYRPNHRLIFREIAKLARKAVTEILKGKVASVEVTLSNGSTRGQDGLAADVGYLAIG